MDNQKETKKIEARNIYYCACCANELTNGICYNTDYMGTGQNCPMYGVPQY